MAVPKTTPKNSPYYYLGGTQTPAKLKLPTKPKPKGTVVRTSTPQNSFTTIETPAQIEERVTRMAQSAYDQQKSALDAEVAQMRKDAEGRRAGLTAAYAAAAKLNAGMGAGVQQGWEQAAGTLSGLGAATTGSIQAALAADLATQEQALSRVGAGGTGFDARSQAAVEQYRNGLLPSEYFTRLGGVGNQYQIEAAQSLANRGLQEGIAGEHVDNAKINTDLLSQVKDLTTKRTDYESDLRKQLLEGQSSQLKAIQDQREFNADLALKKVKIEQAQQQIDLQYKKLRAQATTTAQKFELDKWYKSQNVILSQARNDLAAQRVGIAQQNADTSTTRAANATKANGGKPPSASTISMAVQRANTAGTAAFTAEMSRILAKQEDAHAPDGTSQEDYALTAKFRAAKAAAAHDASIHFFGDIMYRVIESMNDHLKGLGWTKNQIKKAAYELVSKQIPAPRAWLQKNPGFGPKV